MTIPQLTQNKKDYDIRDLVEGDKNFIFATFLKSLRYGSDYFKSIDSKAFFKFYHGVLEIGLNSAKVKVACLKDDPNTILGYSLMNQSETTLHFVFVKSAWRNFGIAKSLVPETTIKVVTHLTKTGSNILKDKPGVIFNPWDLTP